MNTRTCKHCGVEVNQENGYLNYKSMNLRNSCRSCWKTLTDQWKKDNVVRDREIKRLSAVRNRETARKYDQSHKRDLIKSRAHRSVSYAVSSGKLFRPSCCSICGITCKPQGHHHNGYEGDNKLNVIWLCPVCHREEDRKLGIWK